MKQMLLENKHSAASSLSRIPRCWQDRKRSEEKLQSTKPVSIRKLLDKLVKQTAHLAE
jgi:hypothetical protein